MYYLGDKTRITFHDLSFRRRLNDYVVGNEITGSFLVIEEIGVEIIKDLQTKTLGDVEKKYPDYDVKKFVRECQKAGLIYKIGHRIVDHHKPITDYLHIKPERLKWLLHPLSIGFFLGLAISGLLLLIFDPSTIPKINWFFPTGYLAVDLLLALITYWCLLLIHEIGHYLAMARTGHKTGIAIVSRWHYLIPHTNISNARFLTKKDRIIVYLSGLIMDFCVFTIATLLWMRGVGTDFFQLVSLLVMINILFQFSPVKESDLVRVLSQHYGVHNLLSTTWGYLKKACPFCNKTVISEEEKNAANTLPWLFFGSIILVVTITGYLWPITYELITQSTNNLLHGAINNEVSFYVDGMLSLIVMAGFMSFLLSGTVKQHSMGSHPVLSWIIIFFSTLLNFLISFVIAVGLMLFSNVITTMVAMFFLGTYTGALFWHLIREIHLENDEIMKEYLMPSLVAITVLVLTYLLSKVAVFVNSVAPAGIYALSFVAGLILIKRLS